MILSLLSWFYLIFGQFFYFRGSSKKALSLLQKACEGDGSPSGAFLYRALALSSLGRHQEALKQIEREKGTFSPPEILHLFRGKILYEAGKSKEALEAFEKILGKNPGNWLAGSYKQLCQAGDNLGSSLSEFLKPRGLAPDGAFQARLYSMLVQKLCPPPSPTLAEDLEQRREFYKKELQESTGEAQKHLSRCDGFLANKNYEKALEEARQAAEKDPTLPEAHLYLSYHLLRNREFAAARKHLLKRQKLWFYQSLLHPDSLIALSLQISLSIRTGRLVSACKTLAMLENLDMEEWEGRLAKAEVLCALRKDWEGHGLLEKLYREEPEEFTQRLRELMELLKKLEESPAVGKLEE